MLNKLFTKSLEIYAIIFGRSQFIKFNRLIFSFAVRGLGIQDYKNFNISGEKKLVEIFSKLKNNQDELIIFDIGANKGEYSRMVQDRNKEKKVKIFAFEPGLKAFADLEKQPFQKDAVLLNLACGSKNGFGLFHDNKDTAFSSLYLTGSKRSKVKMVKLDTIVKQYKIKSIDLLKLDTEGSEKDILLGAAELIKNKRVSILQFEFNSMNIVSKSFFKDFLGLLNGYSLYRLLPRGIMKIDSYDPLFHEIFSFQNIVAVNKSVAKKFERLYER